jgi:ANTAR domain
MSFPAPPRRPTSGASTAHHPRPGVATTPSPRRATPPVTADPGGPRNNGSRAAGRFRYDRATDAWSWSPEMFAVLGIDPGTTDPGTDALVDWQHPDDRVRTLDAFAAACTGRAFALEVRAAGEARAVVLVGEPELDEAGVTAVEGMCADITAGRPPGSDGDRTRALEAEVGQLRAAMASRAVIEQAKGILMLLTSCRDQTAFDLLGHISSHTHRKIRDVARAITESATGGARLPEEIRTILRDACPPTPHLP